ncbi:MAG: hypothetical protein COX19_01680, partial [Desulfobacterales bacterium CG23_combo_of_CG06-09_8_20_14_all_51_8]
MLASILLLDADGIHVRHAAAPSLPDAFIRAVDGQPIGERAGSCGTAAWRREQVIVEDIAIDPLWADYRELAAAHGLRACWSTPIFAADNLVLGTFALYYGAPALPTAYHQRLITMTTHCAAIAIARKREEEALRDSEAYNRMLFDQSPIGLALARMDGKLVDINFAYANIIGRTIDDTLKLTYWDITPEKYAVQEQQQLTSLDISGVYGPYEKEYIHKDGHLVPVRLQGLLIERKGKKFIWSSVEDITERRQSEKALRESEERLRLSTELANVAVWEYNFTADSMSRSKNHDRLYGLSRQPKWNINTFLNATHPADREISNEIISTSVAPGGPGHYQFDFRVVYPDKSIHWLSVVGQVIERDEEGRGVIVRGCLMDISDRKNAEQALRESEDRFRKVFEEGPLGIAMADVADGRFFRVNRALCDMLGYTEEELKQLTFVDVTHPDHRALDLEAVKEIREGQIQKHYTEKRYLRKNGEVVWGARALTKISSADGKSVYNLAMIKDITDRKRAEKKLQRNEQLLRLFVEHSPASIAMLDHNMKYIVASRRFLVDYDIGDQNLIGRSHYEVFPEIPERWREIHRRCLAGAIEKSEEDPFPRADGKMDWVRWEIHPWYETQGEIGGIILFSEVITDRKKAAEEINRINQELHTINRIILTCATTLDMEELLNKVMVEALAICGLEGGTICFVTPEETLHIVTHRA